MKMEMKMAVPGEDRCPASSFLGLLQKVEIRHLNNSRRISVRPTNGADEERIVCPSFPRGVSFPKARPFTPRQMTRKLENCTA